MKHKAMTMGDLNVSYTSRYDRLKKWSNVQDQILESLRSRDNNNGEITISKEIQVN